MIDSPIVTMSKHGGFSVRYRISEGISRHAMPGTYSLTHLHTLHDCQRAYIATRERADLGGSQFSGGDVLDASGAIVARVSYNGRLWPAEPWTPAQRHIAEAPEMSF